MARIWSTDDVHPRDRLAYWVDGLADAVVHVDCEPRSDEPFVAEIRADSAGEVRCATYSSVAQIATRSPSAPHLLFWGPEGQPPGYFLPEKNYLRSMLIKELLCTYNDVSEY
jgi:hypothetical protein